MIYFILNNGFENKKKKSNIFTTRKKNHLEKKEKQIQNRFKRNEPKRFRSSPFFFFISRNDSSSNMEVRIIFEKLQNFCENRWKCSLILGTTRRRSKRERTPLSKNSAIATPGKKRERERAKAREQKLPGWGKCSDW